MLRDQEKACQVPEHPRSILAWPDLASSTVCPCNSLLQAQAGFWVAVLGLGALVGKGLLAPISMFNRMRRSIFTSRERKLNGGWLRAKVLWEERAGPGWLHCVERGD